MNRIASRHTLSGGLVLLLLALAATPVLAQRPAARGGGPPFCQSGQGHPVHGWSWCVAKGFAPAPAYHRPAPLRHWEPAYWEDVRFHRRPARRRDVRRERWMDRRQVTEVVGEVVVRRIEDYGRRQGVDAHIQARWVSGEFVGVALEVFAGSTPLAFLHDASRDGWVDRVYLRPRTRQPW